jgi:DNA-binding GntR family transcriptional regulator
MLAKNSLAGKDDSLSSSEKSHGSLGDYVYLKIKELIEKRKLKPGDRIMENEVAERFKVSRTPVRDALRKLENDGILVIEPRMGLKVASLSKQAIFELYFMRELLEGTAARLCAENATEFEIFELEELIHFEEKNQNNNKVLVEHNHKLHKAIYHGAHNQFLLKSINAVNDSMWLLGPSLMADSKRSQNAFEQHKSIVDSIKSRNSIEAERQAKIHINAAKEERIRTLFNRQS